MPLRWVLVGREEGMPCQKHVRMSEVWELLQSCERGREPGGEGLCWSLCHPALASC